MPWGHDRRAVVHVRPRAGSLKQNRVSPLEPSGSRTKVLTAQVGDVPFFFLSPFQSNMDLRRQLRARRRALSPAEQKKHAHQAARQLAKHPLFLSARRLGAYWAADGELDPAPLLRLAYKRHKDCHFPVLRPHPRRKLWFVRHREGDLLVTNRYGLPEPGLRNARIRLPWALDLLLVPLVGFDAGCNRLGMGGGYYDQTLAYLHARRHWRRPLLIGLAHECQRIERLAVRPWDIPLDLVVTERRIYPRTCGSRTEQREAGGV